MILGRHYGDFETQTPHPLATTYISGPSTLGNLSRLTYLATVIPIPPGTRQRRRRFSTTTGVTTLRPVFVVTQFNLPAPLSTPSSTFALYPDRTCSISVRARYVLPFFLLFFFFFLSVQSLSYRGQYRISPETEITPFFSVVFSHLPSRLIFLLTSFFPF